MVKKINYLKKFINVLVWPFLFTLGSFFINYIFVSIYNNSLDMSNNDLMDYIKTIEYQNKLNNYINSKSILIVLITLIIFLPIFYKLISKYKKENNFKISNIFLPIILGISISLIYNIIIFSLNNMFHFTNAYEISNIPLITQIICSGIIGPILEELLFRGIVYNKLKCFNKKKTAIILCSIIFGLMHSNIIDAIYAFLVSFILIYLYERYNTLKAPIIMHMSLNITIILMLKLITYNFIVFNLYLLLVSIIVLLIIKKNIKKDV